MTAVAGFDGHQGIALVVGPRTWAGLDDVLARAVERGEPPFVLVLDSLEDPQNVGTLLRSAEAAGVHGVIFPTHRQAPLTPAAIKASAGAVEHLLLCPVDDLPGALSDLRIRGLRVAAAEADAPLTTAQADLRGPLAIIVGSEGQGLSPVVRRRADVAVRIPMRGAIGSLNAAVAGSILLFAAVAQRDPDGSGSGDRPPAATFDELAEATIAAGAALAAERDSAGPESPVATDPDVATGAAASASGPTNSEDSSSPSRRRIRPPAPTTAAQKRSRAARATASDMAEAGTADPTVTGSPAPTDDGAVSGESDSDPSAARPRRATASRARVAKAPPPTAPPASDLDAATGEAAEATASTAPRKRRAPAKPTAEPPPPPPDPAEDELLPGGSDLA